MEAEIALSAFRSVERYDVISWLERFHTLSHLDDNARALVPQDGGKSTFWVVPRQGKASVWQTPVALISIITSPREALVHRPPLFQGHLL